MRVHPGSVSKEVPPAGYVSYFLNHSGIWREIVPCTSLSEREPGHKNAKKRPETPNLPRNHDKRRKTAAAPPNIPCTSFKNKGFGGSPYVYLKVLPVPYLQMRGVQPGPVRSPGSLGGSERPAAPVSEVASFRGTAPFVMGGGGYEGSQLRPVWCPEADIALAKCATSAHERRELG